MLGVWNTPLVGMGTNSINHKKIRKVYYIMGNKITVTCQTWSFKSSTLTHSCAKLECFWAMLTCQTWPFQRRTCQTWAFQRQIHLPNLSIPETNSLAKLEHSRNKFTCQTWAFQRQIHLPNLSIPETNSLAKLEHFRDVLAKLEHSRDKFTWAF